MYKISPWMVFCKHPMTCHTLKCKSTSLLKTKMILLFHLQQKHRSMVWKIKVFNYFPTHFEGTGQPSFWKNLPFFSHLTWFMHGNFHETPADWKEILSPLWFGLKERKLVKDAIDWREREWHDLKNTQVDYNISHILIQSWYSSPCQECLFGGTTC